MRMSLCPCGHKALTCVAYFREIFSLNTSYGLGGGYWKCGGEKDNVLCLNEASSSQTSSNIVWEAGADRLGAELGSWYLDYYLVITDGFPHTRGACDAKPDGNGIIWDFLFVNISAAEWFIAVGCAS